MDMVRSLPRQPHANLPREPSPRQQAHPAGAAPRSGVRHRIVEVVEARPGIPLAELLKEVPIGWGTLYHHIVKLTEGGQLRAVSAGRRRLLFPCHVAADPARERARALLRGDTVATIARAVARRAPTSVRDLVVELEESPRVVYYHVRKLVSAGLVQSTSITRYYGLRPSPLLLALLQTPPPAAIEEPSHPAAGAD
ncbi:MAG TPA: hypothetical protein VM582_01700 [Candidatus Thermoplasmatota archaeon]|nr:hypothetical protein [Candidatus Thermoplasmatota archaeon]